MSNDVDLIPRKDFREWFKTNLPVTDWKLTKLFEDVEYDGEYYKPKRMERKKADDRGPDQG